MGETPISLYISRHNMRVTCPTCSTAFEVEDGEIGPAGALVPCPGCGAQVAAVSASAMAVATTIDTSIRPQSTITLGADDLAELAEIEDDALIEIDDDETIAEVQVANATKAAAAPAPIASFDIEMPEITAASVQNPFAAAFDAEDAAEQTPPPPMTSTSNGDYASHDDDTVVGPHRDTTPAVALADLEVDTAEIDVGAAPEASSPEASARGDDEKAFEVLGGGGAGPDSTLIVRKRRGPAPEAEEPAPSDLTMPRVQQPARPTAAESPAEPARPNVSFSRSRATARSTYLVWGGIVLGVVGAASGLLYWRSLPIAPPEVPNPLEQRADDWRKSGQPPLGKLDDAAAAVVDGLASGTNVGRERALAAARAAVIADPKSPAAVGLYAKALAARDEQLDPTTLNDVLSAITSVVGDSPGSSERPSLETSRAWLLLRAGRLEDAREAAVRAVATRQDFAPAQVVAFAASASLKPEQAVQGLTPLLNNPEVASDARLWLGEAQLLLGQVNEAIATWRGGVRDAPSDAPFLARLARLQADLGDYGAAIDLLAQSVTRGAASTSDVLLLARLQSRAMHKSKQALETLDMAQKERKGESFAAALLVAERVTVALSVKPPLVPPDELAKSLQSAMADARDVPQLIYAGALADLAGGQAKHAAEALEAAQTLAPDAPEIAFALASLSRATDQAGAGEVVATALKERPDYIPLYLLDAAIAAEHDEKPRAITSVRKALTYDPALYVQATLFSAYAEPAPYMLDVAKTLGEQGLRFDSAVLRGAAGMLYVLANDPKNGPLWLTRALRDDPNDVGAHFYSAVLLLRKGGPNKKPIRADLAAAERAERRQPMVRLYKARVFEQIGKLADATKIYRDLVDQNPMNAAAYVGLGRVLRIQGDEQAARDAAKKALGVRPRDREALKLLVAETGPARRDATLVRTRR